MFFFVCPFIKKQLKINLFDCVYSLRYQWISHLVCFKLWKITLSHIYVSIPKTTNLFKTHVRFFFFFQWFLSCAFSILYYHVYLLQVNLIILFLLMQDGKLVVLCGNLLLIFLFLQLMAVFQIHFFLIVLTLIVLLVDQRR